MTASQPRRLTDLLFGSDGRQVNAQIGEAVGSGCKARRGATRARVRGECRKQVLHGNHALTGHKCRQLAAAQHRRSSSGKERSRKLSAARQLGLRQVVQRQQRVSVQLVGIPHARPGLGPHRRYRLGVEPGLGVWERTLSAVSCPGRVLTARVRRSSAGVSSRNA